MKTPAKPGFLLARTASNCPCGHGLQTALQRNRGFRTSGSTPLHRWQAQPTDETLDWLPASPEGSQEQSPAPNGHAGAIGWRWASINTLTSVMSSLPFRWGNSSNQMNCCNVVVFLSTGAMRFNSLGWGMRWLFFRPKTRGVDRRLHAKCKPEMRLWALWLQCFPWKSLRKRRKDLLLPAMCGWSCRGWPMLL